MSSEQKLNTAAVNLYGAYNKELERMHALMQTYLQLPKQDTYQQQRHGSYQPPSYHHGDISVFWKRITQLQDVLIAALQSHDPIIQEKVAELALTGTTTDNEMVLNSTDEIPF